MLIFQRRTTCYKNINSYLLYIYIFFSLWKLQISAKTLVFNSKAPCGFSVGWIHRVTSYGDLMVHLFSTFHLSTRTLNSTLLPTEPWQTFSPIVTFSSDSSLPSSLCSHAPLSPSLSDNITWVYSHIKQCMPRNVFTPCTQEISTPPKNLFLHMA